MYNDSFLRELMCDSTPGLWGHDSHQPYRQLQWWFQMTLVANCSSYFHDIFLATLFSCETQVQFLWYSGPCTAVLPNPWSNACFAKASWCATWKHAIKQFPSCLAYFLLQAVQQQFPESQFNCFHWLYRTIKNY